MIKTENWIKYHVRQRGSSLPLSHIARTPFRFGTPKTIKDRESCYTVTVFIVATAFSDVTFVNIGRICNFCYNL